MEIRPFPGLRYAPQDGDVSKLIAPPYDILTEADKKSLLAQDERNIVRIDLPHTPPKQLGPDQAYQLAAETLDAWRQAGTFLQEDQPAVYVYEQTYTWAGTTHTRRAMLAGVRATELGEDVMPHEHTFAGPKADRLRLTEKTGVQMSPIFGFYHDEGQKVGRLLGEQSASRQPDLQGHLQGVDEKLWAVTAPQVIETITDLLKSRKVYIADGHHRYTTAMNYARSLRESGEIDADHPANFVLFALVADNDEGLIVLPTHRVVHNLAGGFTWDALLESLAKDFEIVTVSPEGADLSDADAFLADFPPHSLAVAGEGGKAMRVLTLKGPEPMQRSAGDHCQAYRELDVAILHTLCIDGALSPWMADQTSVEYTPDGNHALTEVRSGQADLAWILRGTPLASVSAIADAGASMPHKSTYFYPKLATGMVLKPLT